MGEASSKFAPRGNALGLDKPFALADEFSGHVVEASCQEAHFIAAALGDVGFPIAGGHLLRGAR